MERRTFLKSLIGLPFLGMFSKTVNIPKDTKIDGNNNIKVIQFHDNPTGRVAWNVWNKMTLEQKEATGLFNIVPDSTVVMMPGMSLHIKQYSDGKTIFKSPKESKNEK